LGTYLNTEKSVGTVVGMAVGSALGAPAKGKSTEEVASDLGRIDSYRESFDLAALVESAGDEVSEELEMQASRWLPAGVYAEDTQQALAICDCLIHEEDLNGETFADLLCRLSRPRSRGAWFGVLRGVGRSFKESVRSLEDGENWRLSGQESSSNGAAMRVAPLGVYFRDDTDKLKQRVIDQSVLTHRDPMAIAAAQAVAHAVALVLPMRKAPAPGELLEQILDQVRAAEELAAGQEDGMIPNIAELKNGFSEALAKISDHLELPLEEGLAKIAEHAEATSERPGVGATGGYVLSSVVTSLYIFLKNLGTYERAVLAAVNHGGEADTMGAIVGALAGALHGFHAIPARWLRGLTSFEQLKLRGEALVNSTDSKDKLRALHDVESATCARIAAERDRHLPAREAPEPEEADGEPEADRPEREPRPEGDRPRGPRRDDRRGRSSGRRDGGGRRNGGRRNGGRSRRRDDNRGRGPRRRE